MNVFCNLFVSINLLLSIIFFFVAEIFCSRYNILLILTFCLVSYVLFFIRHHKVSGKNLVTPAFIFMLCFFIVFFFIYFCHFILGLEFSESGIERLEFSYFTLYKGVMLSSIGFSSLLLGYFFPYRRENKNRIVKVPYILNRSLCKSSLIPACMIFFSLFVISAGNAFWQGQYVVSALESAWYYEYVRFILDILLMTAIVVSQYNVFFNGSKIGWNPLHYVRNMGWPLSVMVIVYALTMLNAGYRSPAMSILIAYSWLYFFAQVLKIRTVIAGCIFIFIFLSFISSLRSYDGTKTYSDAIQDMSNKDTLFEESKLYLIPFAEFSASISPSHYVINSLGKEELPYFYGKEAVYNIFFAIPFFAPIFRKYCLAEQNGYPGATYITYLHYQCDEKYFPTGLGTNQIADLYLDFGVSSVMLGMFALGFLLRSSHYILNKQSSSLLLFVVTVFLFANGAYSTRGTYLVYFFNVVYVYIFSLIFLYSSKKDAVDICVGR